MDKNEEKGKKRWWKPRPNFPPFSAVKTNAAPRVSPRGKG